MKVAEIILLIAFIIVITKLVKGVLKAVIFIGCILFLIYILYPYISVL